MRKTKEVLRELGAESSTKKEAKMKRYLIHALSLGGLLLGMSIAGGVVASPHDGDLPPGRMFYHLFREEELPCEYQPEKEIHPWLCDISGTGKSFGQFWRTCEVNDTQIPAWSLAAFSAVSGPAFVVSGDPVGRVRLIDRPAIPLTSQTQTVRFLTLCEDTSELVP